MAAKAENPEQKLQQAVGREVEIRLMQDFINKQKNLTTCARWEDNLSQKDEKSRAKRLQSKALDDQQCSKIISKATRKEKLIALYEQDELMYEAELNQLG